ncbi:MAG: ATP-binding protein [Acidobacteria bacterium]|nr:ATP-binding protein [Acidobacteriota bacterium]
MYSRLLPITPGIRESFFLWGPRQSGKTTFLKQTFPDAPRYDLLNNRVFTRLLHQPESLGEELRALPAKPEIVIIDEVQKLPALLDEVHRLMTEHDQTFGLCGSSARKVRRGHANLLGGRAVRFEMFGLVSPEVGPKADCVRFVNHGVLPRHFDLADPGRRLRAYVEDYLREEVLQEGLVRNLPAFHDFLRAAALSDTEIVNFENIARECRVSAPTVREHYQILVDTLLGSFVPAFSDREKRRVIRAPKFYFKDVGPVNHLARRGRLEPGSPLFGKAFENWIAHELHAHAAYSELHYPIRYWRLSSGIEVDFILGDMEAAVEVKATARVRQDHCAGLVHLARDHPEVGQRFLVCLEDYPRRFDDGILVLPVSEFLRRLWGGEIMSRSRDIG